MGSPVAPPCSGPCLEPRDPRLLLQAHSGPEGGSALRADQSSPPTGHTVLPVLLPTLSLQPPGADWAQRAGQSHSSSFLAPSTHRGCRGGAGPVPIPLSARPRLLPGPPGSGLLLQRPRLRGPDPASLTPGPSPETPHQAPCPGPSLSGSRAPGFPFPSPHRPSPPIPSNPIKSVLQEHNFTCFLS